MFFIQIIIRHVFKNYFKYNCIILNQFDQSSQMLIYFFSKMRRSTEKYESFDQNKCLRNIFWSSSIGNTLCVGRHRFEIRKEKLFVDIK